MTEEKGNRVVVIDEDRTIKKIKTDGEIVKENEVLEKELKGKAKKQKLEEILAEKKARKKKEKAEKAKKDKVKKEKDMSIMLVDEQDRSLNWGCCGVGQAGSKVAECFYNRGYNTVIFNTALQDMKFIKIPDRHKLFLDVALGGTGKDLDLGREAAEQYSDEILKHISDNTEECEVLMLIISGGGGSGSGSAETMVNIMNKLGKPVVVLYILPMGSECVQTKSNSIKTLSRLSKLAADDVISSLTVVDNSKIELILPGRSLSDFWREANEVIVEPLHLFNTLSSKPSEHGSLDPMDFSQVLLGSDCSLYGMIEISDYSENEESIAEAVIMNTENGLLSSDFNLEEARNVGVLITGSKTSLSNTQASYLEYGLAMLGKVCGDSARIYRGIYEIPDHPDSLRIYTLFSGLGLPEKRISELKAEADRHTRALEDKKSDRATNMNIDLGRTETTSAAEQIHRKIQNKNSPMGKLKKNSDKKRVIDKRRR